MKPVIAIIGLVLGGLAGAYFGIDVAGEMMQRQTFESPDEVSQQSQMIMLGMMAGVGLVGGIIGWVLASFIGRRG